MFSFKAVYISFCCNGNNQLTKRDCHKAWPSVAKNKRNRSSAPCTESITQVLKMHLTCCALALSSKFPEL